MKKTILSAVLIATTAFAAPPAKTPTKLPPGAPAEAPVVAAKLTADEMKKALYALGVLVAQRTPMGQSGFDKAEMEQVLAGFADNSMKKELKFKPEEWSAKIDQVLQEQSKKRAAAAKEVGASFLAKAEKEAGAQKLPSGIIYFETQSGTGAMPTAADTVKVHYKGTLTDGKEFDSSYKRGQPAEFPLGGVIKCWTEGVAKMKVGGKARLVCPSDLAYGDRGAGGDIPPGAVLNFEVELIGITGK